MVSSRTNSIWILNGFSTFTDYFGSNEQFKHPIQHHSFSLAESIRNAFWRYFDCFGCLTVLEMKRKQDENDEKIRMEYVELIGLNILDKEEEERIRSSISSLEEALSQKLNYER